MFLAGSSSLNVAALNYGVYFLLTIAGIYFGRKRILSLLMLLGAWVGGIINVLALGNYAGRNGYSEEIYILYALLLSGYKLLSRDQYFLHSIHHGVEFCL